MRRKIVEFFPARPFPGESGKALRVSRYFADSDTPGHVRFSVWNETGIAEAVVSLDEADAARLAEFVRDSDPTQREPAGLRSLLQRLARHPTRSCATAPGEVDEQQAPTECL